MENALTTALNPAAGARREAVSAETFDEIVRQHQRRVYRVLFLLLRDADAADTLTQECFLRAYQKLAGFRGECRIETWLLRIAVNLARDHGRNRKVWFWRRLIALEEIGERKASEPVATEASPEQVLLAREELKAVCAAVNSLPEQQRTVFLLRFAEEMALVEIGEVLGLRLGTVKAHLFRATERVREAVRKQPCP